MEHDRDGQSPLGPGWLAGYWMMICMMWAGAHTKRGQPATFHLYAIEQKTPESTRAFCPLECTTASPICALYLSTEKAARLTAG